MNGEWLDKELARLHALVEIAPTPEIQERAMKLIEMLNENCFTPIWIVPPDSNTKKIWP